MDFAATDLDVPGTELDDVTGSGYSSITLEGVSKKITTITIAKKILRQPTITENRPLPTIFASAAKKELRRFIQVKNKS